jgi:hypothetical protein
MSAHQHPNPTLYFISGAFGSIFAFLQDNGFAVNDLIELIKVISFGLIGGACGYAGKVIALNIHRYLKQKSKDVCE